MTFSATLCKKSRQSAFFQLAALGAIAFSNLLQAQEAGNQRPPKAQISRSAEELFQRMGDQWKIDFDNAIGGYVVRIFNFVDEKDSKQQIARFRKNFEESKKIRIANIQTLGGHVDEAAIDAEMEKNIAELSTTFSVRGLETLAVRYFQQGNWYRIEQFNLPNDAALDHLRDELKSGTIQFEPTYVRTWNGQQYAEIVTQSRNSNRKPQGSTIQQAVERSASSPQAVGALSYDDRAAGVCNFTTYARDDAADPKSLGNMAEKGFPVTTSTSQTRDGDPAVLLRIGLPDTVSFYTEFTVLPTKGYCVTSSFMKVNGAKVNRAEYGDFVETSSGVWMPTRIMRESRKFDEHQVPYLATKTELLAFEAPKTNVNLPASTFDLASSKEFKALPLSTRLLPQGNAYLEKPVLTPPTFRRVFLIVANLLVIGALLGFWLYRRHGRELR